jgi:ElaB/YqjD/DUF883 family membrane-anchored ribosome-binding protein
MDRQEFSPEGATTEQGGASAQGTGNFGTTNMGSTSMGSSSTPSDTNAGFADRARDIAGTAREKLSDVGSTARERAGNLKDSLADALESSADKLRQRAGGQSGQLAGTTGTSSVAVETDGRAADVANRVAGGMQASADWLRDADLDGLKMGIEKQVKDHPGRTLLIAVGLGYLLGKALRK